MNNPELMVIGDSLAQGCRSLSVTEAFCAQSMGARITASQGWKYTPPDHPRPVLFDLEDHIRNFNPFLGPIIPVAALGGLVASMSSNAMAWLSDFSSGKAMSARPQFDNLAVAGATIPNLLETTAGDARAICVKTIGDTIAKGKLKAFFKALGDLHYNVNACFTLNPSQAQGVDGKTQVQWVQDRRPRRLIVQVGHNHGLWTTGFTAKYDLVRYTKLEKIEDLAAELAALPDDVREIYYFLLPKVSAVANLEPRGKIEEGYAEQYRPVFAPTPNRISGEQLSRVDRSVRETNDEIRSRMTDIFEKEKAGNSSRLTFIDTYALLDRFDVKNYGNGRASIPAGGKKITNRYVDGGYKVVTTPHGTTNSGTRLLDGGFQSVDGMHPSGVGYAQLAIEVMDLMGVTCDRAAVLNAAFKDDRLLSRYPMELEGVTALIKAIQAALPNGNDDDAAFDDEKTIPLADTLLAMGSTFQG